MSELTFESAPIPAQVTAPKENPFAGVFPSDEESKVLRVNAALDSPEVKRLITQARLAGRAVERTTRCIGVQEGTEKRPVSVLTFWTVAPIKRTRKGSETPAEG